MLTDSTQTHTETYTLAHTHWHTGICSVCVSLACKICSTNEFKRINYYAYATLCEGRRAESAQRSPSRANNQQPSWFPHPAQAATHCQSFLPPALYTPTLRRKLCQAFSSLALSSFLLVMLPVLPFRGCQKTFIQFCTEIHTHTHTHGYSLIHTHTHTQRIKV